MTRKQNSPAAAVAVCVECGGPLDAGPTQDGKEAQCRRCSYAGTLGDIDQATSESRAIIEQVRPLNSGPGPVRKAVSAVVFIIVIVGTFLVWTPIVTRAVARDQHYSIGAGGSHAPGLNACLGGLWQIRAALAGASSIPDSLEALPDVRQTCPGCGGKWEFAKDADGGYRVSCPTPEKHEREAVFLDHIIGPPQVLSICEGP